MQQTLLTINDLADLRDDLFEGAVSPPDEQLDPIGPRPLDEGTYPCRLVALRKDTDDAGNWRDERYPTLLADFEVASGDKEGRKATFIRLSSKPQLRTVGAQVAKVSPLSDVIRAFDPTFNWGGIISVAVKFLLDQQDKGTICKLSFGQKAFDTDHFNANGGPTMAAGSQELKDLYKACTVRGQRNFGPDGIAIGPSGKTLKAKLYLRTAYAAK